MEKVDATGPQLTHWQTWHRLCALGRMPETERQVLVEFMGNRFLTVVRRLDRPEVMLRMPPPRDRAHAFEIWCALHERREGKRYKDWLLHRGDRKLGAIESGVSLLMRKVVREWVAVEFPRHPQLSLDAPLGDANFTMQSLLPAPSKDELPTEAREWLQREVPKLISEMMPLQRVCVSARAQGRVLSDPKVCAAANAGKTTLHKQYREWIHHLGETILDAFPDFSEDERLNFTLETLHQVEKAIFFDFSAEKPVSIGCKEP
ncbi:MAG: hypothetical protein JJU29_12530 [Verrucomicrobia bacterium]|nr:hypothetical protein [Verrucomicrobiota bacterium]MCH8510836.1 hypothetical protein [Kiritimatiellia bacterium]